MGELNMVNALSAKKVYQSLSESRENYRNYPALDNDIVIENWEYRAGAFSGGWIHRHYFKGTEGPFNEYSINGDGKCWKCEEELPENIYAIASLQLMGQRMGR